MKILAKHTVEDVETAIRFQEYGVGIFPQINTKSALKKAIKRGQLLINNQIANTAHFMRNGDIISLLEIKPPMQKPYDLNLKVWFEDDYLAIVEKPAGISVSGNRFATIANALPQNLKPSTQDDATTSHPVHRLDYATTGLLIVGKTWITRQKLHGMFQKNQIQKTYHAVCVKHFKQSKGTINIPLESKAAKTVYKVIKSVQSERFDALNLVSLQPKTGRTHQLRKHLLQLGNPIMGDQKYFLNGYKHKGYGLYLHASKLVFIHPITQEEIQIVSELPQKFKRIFGLT